MNENANTAKKKMPLLTKILIGFVLGILAGIILGERILVVKPVGDLFLRLLRMLVVPLVFSSLVVGVASMQDIKKMGRIGIRTLVIFLITTAIAIVIGLFLANLIQPGVGTDLSFGGLIAQDVTPPSLSDTLLNIVPINPVESLANAQMLQIIAFALFLGIALVYIGELGKPLLNVINSLAEAMYKLTEIVMKFAPFGVFSLISAVVGAQGMQVLLPLLKLTITVYLGCIIHIILVNGLLTVGVFGKANPIKFFKGFAPAMIFSFVTASSAGTLPVSMKNAQENLGIPKEISSFVQPLGATINMDGTALYQGICAVFVAQIVGIDLTITQQLTVLLTALLASIGTAGVPGSGLIMLTMVLTSIGLPAEAIGLVAGIDRILDAARCVPNVTGDAATALVNAHIEGELDREVFNSTGKINKAKASVD